jgi:hypothetical protein
MGDASDFGPVSISILGGNMIAESSLLPTLGYYQVAYESCPPLIRGRNQRLLQAEEVTETCELLLATALRHACPYWLLDGRSHQQEQPQALHNWMREEYFPRVASQLEQPVCIAFLVPGAVWAGLQAKGYDDPLDWHSPVARLGWFTEEGPALVWLTQRRNQPGLYPAAGCAATPLIG